MDREEQELAIACLQDAHRLIGEFVRLREQVTELQEACTRHELRNRELRVLADRAIVFSDAQERAEAAEARVAELEAERRLYEHLAGVPLDVAIDIMRGDRERAQPYAPFESTKRRDPPPRGACRG